MMIYNVRNFAGFFHTLDQCDSEITLVLPDGKAFDWRTNKVFLRSFLQNLDAGRCNSLEVRPCGRSDTSRLICYMLEGERERMVL